MKRHELSSMFPDMPANEFAKLVGDIKSNGLLEPIIVWQGQIVDGWHRYKACLKAGVEPRFAEFDGDDRKALAMVVSRNARRRHLNEAAITGITKRVRGWHENAAPHGGDRKTKGSAEPLVTNQELADSGEISLTTVKRHNAVERVSPALLEMAERGEIGLATAARIAESVSSELLAAPTKAQIADFARSLSERPQSRCIALLRAANDFRREWDALALLTQDDQVVIDAMAEAMFLIRLCRTPAQPEGGAR